MELIIKQDGSRLDEIQLVCCPYSSFEYTIGFVNFEDIESDAEDDE